MLDATSVYRAKVSLAQARPNEKKAGEVTAHQGVVECSFPVSTVRSVL